MDYINRAELLRALEKKQQFARATYATGRTFFALDNAIIKEQPTADVVEVKHGEWIYDEENDCYICSVCGETALNNYRGLSVASNGCPHCLAKMDGGNVE